ncbi:MAG: HAMP domain-containing sensor histidine kinase [Pseudomonadota bacterium]
MPLFKLQQQRRIASQLARGWTRPVLRAAQSRSMLMLLMSGFLLVAAPLVIGLIVSDHQVDRLSRASELLLRQSIEANQAARGLSERLTALERSARQYRVLADAEALAALSQQRELFRDTLSAFDSDAARPELRAILSQLLEQESSMMRRLNAVQSSEEWPPSMVREFEDLRAVARQMNAEVNRAAIQAVDRLQQLGAQARTTSIIQLGVVLAFAIGLAIVFTRMINRPLQQLDRGIRQLSRSHGKPIEQVRRPRDLRALSLRLESVRRRLQRVEQERQRLLGHASHELKTPLSALSEGVSLLHEELLGPLQQPQLEVVEIMQRSVDQLQSQIDTLLSYNRVRTRMETRAHEVLDVEQWVEAVLDGQRLSLRARMLLVEQAIAPEMAVHGDRELLITALDNLVSNAIKYSPKRHKIGILARAVDEHVQLDVADQGRGISVDDRPRIFDPFFRARDRHEGGVSGSGLGLAICRDLVRASDGEVSLVQAAETEQSEWTTIFRITLPLWRTESSA